MATTPPAAGAETTPVAEAQPQPAVAQPTPAPAAEPAPVEDQALESPAEAGDFSLADLAGLDVSGVAEIRSERLPAMAALFRGKSAKLSEQDNKDGERRFVATVVLEVVEVQALIEKDHIPLEELPGKTHTERFWIVPEKAHEGIGRIRGWYTDVGLDSAGALGGNEENGQIGVLDRIVGHIFPAKITVQSQGGDKFSRLKLPKPTKKA